MNYAQIRKMDISNGPGIRVSLFVSGCRFHCLGCFNKEAQDFNFGKQYTQETEDIIYNEVMKPHVQGLSILGGEPLHQNAEGLAQLTKLCKRIYKHKNIWLWTGYKFETAVKDDKLKQLISLCDVVVDGQFDYNKKDYTLLYRGSSNQRIIDVYSSLKLGEVIEELGF